jgi:hypothetical protein
MDIQTFRVLLTDQAKTQQDLVTMRDNALRANEVEHVHAAEAELDGRFPSWRAVKSRRGGAKPTDVAFQGKQRHFDSEKEAYVWLIERFVQHHPKPFVEIDWETRLVAKGPRALFFAKSLKRLFGDKGQHLAADATKYHRLTNGWYAKLVLSEDQKLGLLKKFSIITQLRFGVDWDWNSLGKNATQFSADDLLREIEGL